MNLQGGLLLLQEVLNDLPASERKVAQFILNNPKHFIALSITELAEESGTSAAGVVRLCKRLRMSGFRELKLRITMDVSQSTESQESLQIQPGASLEDIAKSLVHNNEVILHDILKTLDLSSARTAVDIIASARKIDIYASGSSSIVAHDLSLKLLKLGLSSSYHPDTHFQIASACGLTEQDLAVAISYTGENRGVLAAVREAMKARAKTVSITRFSQNSLASMCDINLFVPSTEPLLKQGGIVSRIALMLITDILLAGAASLESRGFVHTLVKSREALERLSY